jgi:hypothetical protein
MNAYHEKHIDELIELIYEIPLTPDGWKKFGNR